MTSKNFSSNVSLVWDALKKKVWMFIITCVGFFFILPVAVTMSLQNLNSDFADKYFEDNLIAFLRDFLGAFNPATIVFLSVLAFMAGIVFFSYLHSNRKVDFYHTLPITRTKMFFVNYLAGAITVILPFVIFYLCAIAIVGLFGDWQYVRKMVMLQGLVFPILYFLAVYSLAVLAGILTGNIIIHGCVTLYILFVAPVAVFECTALMSNFFLTYAGQSYLSNVIMSWSSPVTGYFVAANYISNGVVSWARIVFLLLFTVIPLVLAVLLYNKRRSEAAGKALAFPWFAPLVKYPLIIMGAIGLGLLFYSISSGQYKVWLIFGVIIGGFLVSRAMEVILAFDIKALKSHWLNLIISLLVAGGIISFFVFDLPNYDKYIPASNKVETVNIEIDGLNMYGRGYVEMNGANNGGAFNENAVYYNSTFPLDNRVLLTERENIKAVLSIAENGVKGLGQTAENQAEYEEAWEEARASGAADSELVTALVIEPQSMVTIKYILSNGKTVARQYDYVSRKATAEAVGTIVDSAEFKRNQLAYLDIKGLAVESIYYSDTGFNIEGNILNKENQQKLIAAYKEDANNLTLEKMKTEKIVGNIAFNSSYDSNYIDITAPIYASYANTLEVLAAAGYGLEEYGSLQPEYIHKITKNVYSDEEGYAVSDEVIPAERYQEILESTHSDNEALYHYFLSGDVEEGYHTEYFIEGTLPQNSFSVSVYRIIMQPWE